MIESIDFNDNFTVPYSNVKLTSMMFDVLETDQVLSRIKRSRE